MANLLEVSVSQTTRPLCYTQISAANQACAILSPEAISSSFVAATNGSRHQHHGAPRDGDDDDDGDDDGGDDGGDDGDDDGGDGGGDDDHDGGDDDHGDDDDHGGDDDDHHHRRRKHKGKKKRHHESSANKECCRWLQEVDNDCVCEVLLKLPPFLVKPKHKFMVRVGRTCRLSYNCPGMLPIPRGRRHR
ncbi:sarcoplasmic reticulum histidine-rich calcium-binding protein-like protein [Carex littledalei]|uniref:Sarcoplasmic reticulum histidine-rich calcium-binding protein-like protein n=1 Tax=Carex littledalei TaxID=544730 RepID=A0A833VHJ2_9POAL|nr:sarcoplasmic reticulum histidine-rich calcium-binding protein-like protein [Carex littledalei]